MGIHNDFRSGKKGEQLVIDLYESLGYDVVGNPSKKLVELAKYDLEADNGTIKFKTEVKNDLYAERSGNIAIEVYNPKSGKPSGIHATTAEIWCHITEGLYFVSVKRLKEYITYNQPYKSFDKAGDGNANILLYKAHIIFPSIFTRLDHVTPEEAHRALKEILERDC